MADPARTASLPRPAPGRPAPPRPGAPATRGVEPLWRHAIGRLLRRLRHERGETLAETARRAGVSPQYLSEVERGAKDPSSEMVAALAGALGLTLLDLTVAVADDLAAPPVRSRPLTARAVTTRAVTTRAGAAGAPSAVSSSAVRGLALAA